MNIVSANVINTSYKVVGVVQDNSSLTALRNRGSRLACPLRYPPTHPLSAIYCLDEYSSPKARRVDCQLPYVTVQKRDAKFILWLKKEPLPTYSQPNLSTDHISIYFLN